MNGLGFFRIIDEAFVPFLAHLGFSMEGPCTGGRVYSASFSNETHSVGISFEPGDDRFLILLFTKENGKLSEIDDRVKTPRLAELNERYMQGVTREERAANEAFFKSILADDSQERVLLKYAKELRLVLPRHLGTKS
jgi:hypothetical protein